MVAMLRDRCALERERMQRWGSDAFGEIEAYADLGSGSDRTGAPAGIVTELRPPKVTAWIEPGLTLVELFGAATVPEPIRRGAEPYSFERRMQIWAPPMDTRTRSRTVWSSMLSSGSCGSGADD